MRRPGGSDFAPDAYVFPGGSVHAEDVHFGQELRAAAARELFEEMGVLLARSGTRFAGDEDSERLRHRLDQGAGWAAALRSLDLVLALDELAPFARWITPERLRRRFDTTFYVTAMPDGQTVHAHAGEVAGWEWVEPRSALSDTRLTMVRATERVLETALGFGDRETFMATARSRTEPLVAVRPRIVVGPDGTVQILEEP